MFGNFKRTLYSIFIKYGIPLKSDKYLKLTSNESKANGYFRKI